MNPTDPNTLLPCPFCGKPGVAQHESFFTHGCASPKCPGYLGATSAEEWNTRAPSAELTQAQAALSPRTTENTKPQ